MNEEEKKAIDRIDTIQDLIIENGQYNADIEDMEYFSKILNLIKKQQKELEPIKKLNIPVETLVAEFNRLEDIEDNIEMLKMKLKKKNAVIDKMAELIYKKIDTLEMGDMAKEINYSLKELYSGIEDEEAIKIIKNSFTNLVEKESK